MLAVAAIGLGGSSGDEDEASPTSSWVTDTVTRGTLTSLTSLPGTLGYASPSALRVRANGTVTWLPAQDQVIRRGESLVRVDDRPIPLMYGPIPMYRDLGLTASSTSGGPASADGSSEDSQDDSTGAGSTDGDAISNTGTTATAKPLQGRDVRELETNLAKMGYGGFTVDDLFTKSTADAVKHWQRTIGVSATGVVGVGDVVFRKGAVRVAAVKSAVGQDAPGDLLDVTKLVRQVSVKASADDLAWATVKSKVEVSLPDGKKVAGRVATIGSTASRSADENSDATDGGEDSTTTIPVTVTIANQDSLGKIDSAPVSVSHVNQQHRDVLSVPVAALVALAEGGYGIEVVDGDATHYLPVKTGMFTDARVEIEGARVKSGMTVRLPQ